MTNNNDESSAHEKLGDLLATIERCRHRRRSSAT